MCFEQNTSLWRCRLFYWETNESKLENVCFNLPMSPVKRRKENEFQFKRLVCIQTLFSIQRTLSLRRNKGKIYNMPLHCNLISIDVLLERKTETLKCRKLPEISLLECAILFLTVN